MPTCIQASWGTPFSSVIGIPVGTNCAPLLADLFLYSYKSDFLDNMIRSGHRNLPDHLIYVFNILMSWEYVKDIYLSQLNVEKTNQSDNLASYPDLTFTIEKDGKLSTKLYDKCDDFDFHIVNFPFL